MYAIKVMNSKGACKAKGLVKDYKECLYSTKPFWKTQYLIRSNKHTLLTTKQKSFKYV